MANTSGWYYSIEGNRALKDNRKGQWNQFYFQQKQKISKKSLKQSQKISKNLKISQNFSNVVSQTWFCETGFFIAYFSGPQKISKNLKIFQICRTKNKKTRKKQNKTKQTNANLQKPWTISAILALFPQAVKCYFLHCILLQPDSV